MASKGLCCTAEQDTESISPDLPNARPSQFPPARFPLLHQRVPSQNSRFTSARSEDLHELRQIFESADPSASDGLPPTKHKGLHRIRPSVHSLHTVHRIKSVHAFVKKRLSKDITRTADDTNELDTRERSPEKADVDTVIKVPREGPQLHLKLTKADLRKDLLSDKSPADGGYDPDAEVLEDVVQEIGRKSPSKRPSVHSINWTPSTGSKTTPESAKATYTPAIAGPSSPPYELATPSYGTFRLGQFSAPNLRFTIRRTKERKIRRSHSLSSIDRPTPSPIIATPVTAIRLPSISADEGSVPWSVAIHESLHLSRQSSRGDDIPVRRSSEPARPELAVHIQEPTASPRVSTSAKDNAPASDSEETEDNQRQSIHLYSMRISHHLRSGSLLSWDALADGSSVPTPTQRPRRHERQTSSSGFASSRVPSKWGRVIPQNQPEEISSIYSSRPHSPPDSFGGSMMNLASPATRTVLRRSHSLSFSPNSDETPKPSIKLPRNNSVHDTKKSKFREEFSPTPPRKKSSPALSLIKMLRPHIAIRSQSDSNLKVAQTPRVEGPPEQSQSATTHVRHISRSFTSMQKEQQASGKDKDADPVWEKALKAYQTERSTMFLPGNQQDAQKTGPFRERSASNVSRSRSMVDMAPSHPGKEPLESKSGHADEKDFGSWARYPSHTRALRTSSAGPSDGVQPHDFAPPTDDPGPSSPSVSRKGITKSHSMSFASGKSFIKNYTRMFRSQSTEFRRHGHGHRSSVAAGQQLEYPELEMLPGFGHAQSLVAGGGDVDGIPEGAVEGADDRARVWSVYYGDCVTDFPRVSVDRVSGRV